MSKVELVHGHRLVVEHLALEDGVLSELEVSIEHPDTCGWSTPCALGQMEDFAGAHDALGLTFGPSFEPPAYDLLRVALTTGRASLALTYRYRSWTDYWGEFEDELTWWVS